MKNFRSRSSQARDTTNLVAKLFATTILTLSLTLPVQSMAAELVAAYSFDSTSGGTVADVSGKGNTLTLQNGAQTANGRYGLAASFDGADDLATAAYNPALNLIDTGFTLSAWINPRSNGGWQSIVNKPYTYSHSWPYYDWSLNREISSGRLMVYLGCDQGLRTSNGVTQLNTWTHVAVTFDGSNLRFYINGQLDRTTPVSCRITNGGSRGIRVGANGGGSEVVNGTIDDVRIYDRVLSAGEIQSDLGTPLGSSGSPTDIVPPSVSVIEPQQDATVSGTVILGADASDDTGVSGVQFQVDGQNVGAEDARQPFNASWNTALLGDATRTVTAIARDAAGNRRTSPPVTVHVRNQAATPTASLAASPTSVASGGSSTLSWSSTNATGCVASGAWSGNRAASGSTSTGALTAPNNTFNLSCSGAGGSASASATVTVTPSTPAPTVSLSANPTSVVSGGSATLSWSSTNATSCAASGAWSGGRPTAGSVSTGALTNSSNTFTLTCSGAGGSGSASATVTVTPATPSPTLSLSATPTSVNSGASATLSWSSTNATSCAASGAWSGSRSTSGSADTGALTAPTNTFTLSCSGAGGSISRSATVTVNSSGGGGQSGLNFQGSASTSGTVRFHFTNPLSIYPATYIWKVYPRRQNGYYTTFFWGNNGNFYWDNGAPNTYYGAHPYPVPPPSGSSHKWEISVDAGDYQTNEFVEYDRWYTQALRVWSDGSGKHHEFYWDLPNTSRMIRVDIPSRYGNTMPPQPVLVFGDAPWAPSNEILDGILRGIQVYSSTLTLNDVLSEASNPLSTSSGSANIWYLNSNPTPSDIADKSGRGHHPQWVGSERPQLWQGQ